MEFTFTTGREYVAGSNQPITVKVVNDELAWFWDRDRGLYGEVVLIAGLETTEAEIRRAVMSAYDNSNYNAGPDCIAWAYEKEDS